MLPFLLLAPQLLVTFVFFYWPASQAVWQSFLLQDAFGLKTDFVWFENYTELFRQGDYYRAMATTAIFSVAVTTLSLSIALLLAVQADKSIKGAGVYKTLLIWPYAVAPAIAGVLWLFMFQPSLGLVARGLRAHGRRLEPAAQRQPRHAAGGAGLHLEADQLQFPVLPRRPAVDPALGDRGRRHRRRAAHHGASGPSSSRCCRPPPSSCWWSTSSTCSSTPSASSTP